MQAAQEHQPLWIVFEDDRPLAMCTSSTAVQCHVDQHPERRRGVLYAPAGVGNRFPVALTQED